MKAEDTCDVVSFMFEAPQQDRIADFELKLMDIDAEQLGIPDTDYSAKCVVNSAQARHGVSICFATVWQAQIVYCPQSIVQSSADSDNVAHAAEMPDAFAPAAFASSVSGYAHS